MQLGLKQVFDVPGDFAPLNLWSDLRGGDSSLERLQEAQQRGVEIPDKVFEGYRGRSRFGSIREPVRVRVPVVSQSVS